MSDFFYKKVISQSLGYITEEELSNAEEMAERLSKVMSGLKKYLTTKT